MLDQPAPPDDLLARSETARFESLQVDLEMCHTLVDFAMTERRTGDPEGFQQARTKAESGYSTISRLMSKLDNQEHRKKIQVGLDELRVALDQLWVVR